MTPLIRYLKKESHRSTPILGRQRLILTALLGASDRSEAAKPATGVLPAPYENQVTLEMREV
jgi:hypothetical protein